MKAIILAAGYATRLYPLTKDRPKALLDVAGRSLLDRICDQIEPIAVVNEIVIISNHRFIEAFQVWAARRQANRQLKPVKVIDDGTTSEEDRLGAIGDLDFAIRQLQLDEDILVIAGDNLFTYNLKEIYDSYSLDGRDMILGQKLSAQEDPTRFAIAVMDDRGSLLDLEEKPRQPKSDIAIYATYFYRRDTLPLIRQYLQAGLNPDSPGHFPEWLYKRKSVRVYLFSGDCYDIGTKESYAYVQELFSRQ
ncbi:MAG: nucleotidyltransferase family protein [Oscillospiraceae bacterium]|nr:nucleotidyltransferase family protein [Oscillospiraceae bacterium]MDD4367918.1 nucleotidyltransferase family protein [Oscillospiraceae bacterium]